MEFEEIRNKFIEHLGDKDLLLVYHCHVACFFMDRLDLNHEKSNFLAHELIERVFEPLKYNYIKLMNNNLCSQPGKEEQVKTKEPKEQVDSKNSKLIMFSDLLGITLDEANKLLLSAMTVLTTSKFNFKGKNVDGTKKTPHEIKEMLNELSEDIKKSN